MSNLLNIFSLFDAAIAGKLKYPKIHLRASDGTTVVIKLNGARSRYNGQLCVTNDAPYGSFQARYFGRIDRTGTFHISTRNEAVNTLLGELAANPVEVAANHGHITGHCCFCQLPLSDPQSLAVGYGPVCAKHWGLPHGAAAQRASNRELAPLAETFAEVDALIEADAPEVKPAEDVEAYDALIARADLRDTMLLRFAQVLMSEMRAEVLANDVAEPVTQALPPVPGEPTWEAPTVPLVGTEMHIVEVPAQAFAINPQITAAQVPVEAVDCHVVDLDVLRAELKKVTAQFKKGAR